MVHSVPVYILQFSFSKLQPQHHKCRVGTLAHPFLQYIIIRTSIIMVLPMATPSSMNTNTASTAAATRNGNHNTNNNNHYYHQYLTRMIRSSARTMSTWSKSNENLPFIIATLSVFLFFGIHNYMQELIQHEFQLYQLPLNVMLGYFEVLGVCVFTYLERYMMVLRQQLPQSPHQPQQQNGTIEEGSLSTPNQDGSKDNNSSPSNNSNSNNISNYNHHNDHSIGHHNNNSVATRRAPLSVYPFLTLCLLSSSALSNLSLNYINFPTKVVFRSCKLLPTMVIATLLHPNKKKFTMIEYICASIVCLGLICFGMAEFQTQPTFHPIGILFVSLSVFADALLPNAQERVFVQYHAPRSEVTFYTNLFTLMIMTVSTYASGDLWSCFRFMYEHSTITIYIFIYTVISYIAISCHMNVVQMYGGVAAVLVATGRKAMTLIVSFLLFPKVYTVYYPIGTILVLSGLTWASLSKIYSKSNDKKSKKQMSADSVVVPLLSLKTHRSDITNDEDDGYDHVTNTSTASRDVR